MTGTDSIIAHARIGEDGRLGTDDARILALQQEAGGTRDGIIAVPPIASIARLARTLGIVVSRGIVVGGAQGDLDLWVRAQIDGADIKLAISGWQILPVRPKSIDEIARRNAILAELDQDGRWSCDAQLRIRMADIGLDPTASFNGLPLTAMLRIEPDDQGELPLLDGLARQERFSEQPASLRALSGTQIMMSGHPECDQSGQLTGFSGQYRWLSRPGAARAKRAGGQPTSARALPQSIQKALRAPLDSIIRDADAISMRVDGPLRQDYAGYAADIGAASRHMLGLVDDLGDLQAIESRGFAVDSDTIDLSELVRRAASILSVRASDRSVKIDVSDADAALMARGDYRRTLQILVNLIGNAVRYAPGGTAIWVRMEEAGDLVAVIVADQGHGIAMSDQDRIFEKFERVNPGEPGTSGLGLYISRALARAMGGDITVDSAPGQGARFALTLPVERDAGALPDGGAA